MRTTRTRVIAVTMPMVTGSRRTLVDYHFKAAAEAKPALTKRFDEEIAAQPKE